MHQIHPFDLGSSTATRNPKAEVPYSDAALRQDLQRIRILWDQTQATRQRDAIYGYLAAVYPLVTWWAADGREIDRSRRALRLLQLEPSDREDRSPPSFGAPETRPKPTCAPGASGLG
jgi:hypothetical protein